MDASLISDEQLSALELMMNHADDAHINVQGAPRKRKRKISISEMFPNGFDTEEVYVGEGSRAKNREMRGKKNAKNPKVVSKPAKIKSEASGNIIINNSTSDSSSTQLATVPVTRPESRDVVKALETLFAEQTDDSDSVVKAVNEGTQTSKHVAEVMADWLKWSKDRAFLEDHRVRADQIIGPPANSGNNSDSSDEPDADFPDSGRDNDRYGRDRRGNRRRDRRGGRRGGGRRGRWRLPRLRGKGGKLLALGAAVLGAGAGLYASNNWRDDESGANATAGDTQPTETPTGPTATPQSSEVDAAKKTSTETVSQDTKDLGMTAATTGALLLGGAKKIPYIGTAVSLADAAYDANKINNDQTLSASEKKTEQIKNVAGAGGAAAGTVAGAWIGGIIGSVVPVAGTAAGAAIGGLIGNALGNYFGDSIGGYVAEKITDETDAAVEEAKKKKDEETKTALLDNPIASKYNAPVFMPFALGGASPTGAAASYDYGGRMARSPSVNSARADEIAKKVLSSDKIGGVSEQFESGGRGVGTVSSGTGDYGGVSYGKHQLASNNGSMSQFLNSPEAKGLVGDFGGLTPGTSQFNQKYKEISGTRGKEMEDAQYQYLVRTHYAPTAEKLEKNLGIDVDKQGRAFKEMVYSTSMQYGGNASSKIERALKGKDLSKMTQQEMLEAVQKDKLANIQNDFRSSSAGVQQGVADRTMKELEVLKQVGNEPAPTEVAKTDAPIGTTVPPAFEPEDNMSVGKGSITDDGKIVTSRVTAAPTKEMSQVAAPLTDDERIDAARADIKRQSELTQRKIDYIKRVKAGEIEKPKDMKTLSEIVTKQYDSEITPKPIEPTVTARQETITPVERSVPEVERAAPLAPILEPVEPSQAQQEQTKSSASGQTASTSNAPPSRQRVGPNLDDIPVYLDDPTMNFINMGYI